MKFLTQFYYEKIWTQINEKEVLRLIGDEFPEVPAQETYDYVEQECKKGKTIAIGECRFKAFVEEEKEE